MAQFSRFNLADAERRALVLVREMTAITNLDYQQVNGTDTLTASSALRHLRDLGLLVMKGSGSRTYYKLVPEIMNSEKVEAIPSQNEELTPQTSSLYEGLAPHISPSDRGLDAIT
ncbi:MAG: hypothetical protein K940chlam9_00871 [Chlamydiae bacterium]|nr:hypothetical protein [Chlamydiota bacterium]